MAYIVPSDLSRLALSGAHQPELETLRALKAELPNDYTVFHGVHWTREYKGWTHFGEIDFVVLNRSGDLLFVEQKNGVLSEDEGGLRKDYQDGAKSPVDQVHRSIDKVREKFQWRHGKQRPLQVDYLVYLPDYRIRDLNAAGLDASRVVDAPHADSLSSRIQELLGSGVADRDGWYEKVHEFFCQTFEVVPDIQAHRDSHERTFVRQVGPVAAVLTNLEMTPFRLRFAGAAGSGKSLVARHFFARASGEGKKVLLTCFNRPLAERLKSRVPRNGLVDTFHGFCIEFLKSKGRAPDFEQADVNQEFWRRIPELVTAERIPDEWIFDALVVDEGQDFDQEWFEILRLFLSDEADVLWLEDPDQNLQGKSSVVTEGFVGYRCPVNYRSPESIARFIRNTLPFDFELGNDLPGMGVGVHGYENSEEQPKAVAKIVQDLVRRGFSHDDMVIVTCRGARNSVFSDIEKVGGIRLRRFTGDYDSQGNQVLTDGQLTFDSIYRFKGQEAPAVILVDVDPQNDRIDREERLLYCGMTRATVRLDMVVCTGNAENRRFLEA
ncbi:MAG: NERD domain-containing protein [Candidatus Thiodiazotropha sp.]